ncbi:MAG: hypothetical protein ACRERS_08100, partial [Methylococcales bacterium]
WSVRQSGLRGTVQQQPMNIEPNIGAARHLLALKKKIRQAQIGPGACSGEMPKGLLISKMFQPTSKSSFRQSLPRPGIAGGLPESAEGTDGKGLSTSLCSGYRQSLPT